jgi:hypothetical protein
MTLEHLTAISILTKWVVSEHKRLKARPARSQGASELDRARIADVERSIELLERRRQVRRVV